MNYSFHLQMSHFSVFLWFNLSLFLLQAQCLINVSGDAVICVRETEQEHIPSNIGQTCTSGTDKAT